MAKKKTVSLNIWTSRDFHSLSKDAKIVWFHLITGSHTGRGVPGLFRGTRESLRIETKMPATAHTRAFNEIVQRGMMELDAEEGVIWLPQAVKWNLPSSYTEVRGWADGLGELPFCKVVDSARCKTVMFLYTYKSKQFAEVAWGVWAEVFGDLLTDLSLDDVIGQETPSKGGHSDPKDARIVVEDDVSDSGGTVHASSRSGPASRARVCVQAPATPASIHTLDLDLIPDPISGVAGRARGLAGAREPDMSDDVAEVVAVWLDEVCRGLSPKPPVAQAHADLVAGLLAVGVAKSTLISALHGAAEDPYVQGTKRGAPRNGRRDLLWLFRSLEQIQMFATAAAEAQQRKPKTWITPADLAEKKEEMGPIAPENREQMQKVLDILGKPPIIAPGVPPMTPGAVAARGVQATSGKDVLGGNSPKDRPIKTLPETSDSMDPIALQTWVDEIRATVEGEREEAIRFFEALHGRPFPRELLTGTTVPREGGTHE